MPPQSSAAARAQYVSPATTQATIDVRQNGTSLSGYPQTVALTPTSGGCTSTLANTACQLMLPLAPGSYTLYLTAKDANGTALSSAQNVPFTVVAGAANAVNVSLGGVPVAVQILPGASSTIAGNASTALTYGDCITSQSVSVLAVDADGNYIIGQGAPTVTLSSDDTAHLTVASTGSAAPNAFTLSCPLGSVPWGSTIHLIAGATLASASGATAVTSTVPLLFYRAVAGTFTEFPTLVLDEPRGTAITPDGSVWFGLGFAPALSMMAYDGTGMQDVAMPSTAKPEHGTIGPDGAYWFTDYSASDIGRVTSSGATTTYAITAGGLDDFAKIANGPDGALWFPEALSDRIGRITTSGTVTEYPVPTVGANPSGMAVGPDGALWFGERFAKKIGRVTTSGTFTEFSVSPACPSTVAFGADGALWFGDVCNNAIVRMTTAGTVTNTYALTTEPRSLAAGPDSAIWFTEVNVGKIGRVGLGGGVIEYVIPSAGAGPDDIVTGRDGSIWFAESATSKMARIR